ncbi:FHA domain-containing protein [Aliikangiella sp. IMCC44653]
MPAHLTICYADQPAVESVLFESSDYQLGRSSECDLVVEHATVSRKHATVSYNGERWNLDDAKSQNGTRVNGSLIKQRSLTGNELIAFGSVECLFELKSQQQVDAHSSHQAWRLQQARLAQAEHSHDELSRALNDKLFSLLSLTGMERGLILLGEDFQTLKICAAKGMASHDVNHLEFQGSVGAISQAINHHKTVVAMDVCLSDFLASRESTKRKKIASLACVPLLSDKRPIGVVYVDSHQTNKVLSQMDMEIMSIVCEQIQLNTQALVIQQQLETMLQHYQGDAHSQPLINQSIYGLVS